MSHESTSAQTTEREVASGLLSEHASFRLILSGQYGLRQIETIVRHLIITRDGLFDSEVEEIESDLEWAE